LGSPTCHETDNSCFGRFLGEKSKFSGISDETQLSPLHLDTIDDGPDSALSRGDGRALDNRFQAVRERAVASQRRLRQGALCS
jgi:hypothetical protein